MKFKFSLSSLTKLSPSHWLREDNSGALFDRQLLWLVLSLMSIGLVMVSSSSLPEGLSLTGDPFYFAKRHAIYLGLSLSAFATVLLIPMARWSKYSGWLLLLTMALMFLVLIIGRNVNGSTRWISLGFMTFQPSELAKLALFIYTASYLVRRLDEIREEVKGFLKPLAVFIVFAFLLYLQPDLGSLVVMCVTVMGMLFIGGARLVQFFMLCGAAGLALGIFIILAPYRVARMKNFVDPWQDPFGAGYQLTQSLMAFGRGGWLGEGLGNSIQKLEYLPEAHTDFVVAVFAEELGFIGMFLLLCLLTWLVSRVLIIGRKSLLNGDAFNGFLAIGIAVWFTLQIVVNIGMAAGLLPTKGLTLPLISYGGSSLLVMSVAMAIVLRIDFELRSQQTHAYPRRAHG